MSAGHNESVRTLGRIFVAALALLVAASAFADLRSAATVMACCAKTNYQCAGLSGPDDCCQGMGHVVHRATPGRLDTPDPVVSAAASLVSPFIVERVEVPGLLRPSDMAFTRPHDPPHLHSFSLLI